MEDKDLLQFRAFLLSHQMGEDPTGYITKVEHISMMHPSEWNGKLPSAAKFKPDLSICKVAKATKSRPIIPWWWYLDQKEPVPPVVENIYKKVSFDYVLFFPKKRVWIYMIIEPAKQILALLQNQDNLRAFIMMSIVNKNLKANEREANRLRLGKVIKSPEINKIFTFVVYSENYEFANKMPPKIPTVAHIVDVTSTNWRINFPGRKQFFWSFKELLSTLFGSPIHV